MRRCIDEAHLALETTEGRWREAEVHHTEGQIALLLPQPNAAKGENCFERALVVARDQQAKSSELRAAIGMARLWREQGKRQRAHDLLAPAYGWFTEGLDTLDLKEAKTVLEQFEAAC